MASAIRMLAKAILTDDTALLRHVAEDVDVGQIRGHLLGEYGLGRQLIVKFLHGIPGITDPAVEQQLANLKTSGDYSRIMAEV